MSISFGMYCLTENFRLSKNYSHCHVSHISWSKRPNQQYHSDISWYAVFKLHRYYSNYSQSVSWQASWGLRSLDTLSAICLSNFHPLPTPGGGYSPPYLQLCLSSLPDSIPGADGVYSPLYTSPHDGLQWHLTTHTLVRAQNKETVITNEEMTATFCFKCVHPTYTCDQTMCTLSLLENKSVWVL